jgi:hypothetical protein
VTNPKGTIIATLVGAAWMVSVAASPARAADPLAVAAAIDKARAAAAAEKPAPAAVAAERSATSAPAAAAKPASSLAAVPEGKPATPAPAVAAPSDEKPAPPPPMIQVTGRLIYTWYESSGLRVILVSDGFTVLTTKEQLTARDGCIWFDEEASRKTGKVTLGVYAETGVEYKNPTGKVEKFDSVYLVMESAGEIDLHSDEPLRPKLDSSELYLRAKKLRKEFLASGRRETPTGVVPPPEAGPKVPAPGLKEAGVPKEISIIAQDDVRQVNFTSFVENGMRISIWSGGVFVVYGDMDVAADNLVIWTPEEVVRQAAGAKAGEAKPAAGQTPAPAPAAESKEPGATLPAPAAPSMSTSRKLAAEAYFEGHVRVHQSRRTLQCSQMYYDFRADRALAVDTKIRSYSKLRNVPVYYYAKEVRELAQGLFVGTDAWMTTCEFGEPHQDVGAAKMTLTDLTPPPGETGEKAEYRRVRFAGDDVQARIGQVPVTWWPRLAGDVSEAETALRAIRIENRRNRGTGLVTQWHLMKLLGIEQEPEGFDLFLDADYWSKLGPAVGIEGKYARENFYGEFLTYYIHDTSGGGTTNSSNNNTSADNNGNAPDNRYRATWRHRQYLPDNWELTLEFSKISDRNFMHDFFQKEDETGKTQETLLYLKKQDKDQALTILASARLNDWQTQTEFFPQVEHRMIGHSFWKDHLTYFEDSQIAIAKFRPDKQGLIIGDPRAYLPPEPGVLKDSPGTLIADTIHELDLPLKAGVVNVVPFVQGRLTYFQHTLDGGSDLRLFAKEGARASTQASRVFNNVESDFWDLHRLRHVMTFDAAAYAAQVSTPARELIPFDVVEAGTPLVEGVDKTGILELGWRNRLQTKRGPEGQRVNVDWLTLDLEATFYNNREFPNIDEYGKRAFNHIRQLTDWKVTDVMSVWTDTNFNLDQGSLDKFTIGTTITHTPRLSYSLGQRLIPDAHSNVTFISADYEINEKWRVAFLEQYDWGRQKNAKSSVVLARRLHCWIVRVRFDVSANKGENFVGIEFQPIGVSEVRVGW